MVYGLPTRAPQQGVWIALRPGSNGDYFVYTENPMNHSGPSTNSPHTIMFIQRLLETYHSTEMSSDDFRKRVAGLREGEYIAALAK
ncbi:hypothetical protein A3K63_02240 [Candidatus Micrarchaeota archaeon RBG_16_49_10]|nr:MAG: hypothetical protein A3K63_02240 [Candidatus Micrarchaeota archaeon RBG_16_49_10]